MCSIQRKLKAVFTPERVWFLTKLSIFMLGILLIYGGIWFVVYGHTHLLKFLNNLSL